MEEERVYSVREEALKRGWQEGFRIEGNTLVTVNKEESRIIIPFFDRGYGEKRWGRLHMDMELKEKSLCTVYVMASDDLSVNKYFMDDGISVGEKAEAFKRGDVLKFTNMKDALLYDAVGRYLWILIVIKGDTGSSAGNIKVYTRGDFIMEALPEIYRERNSTLHRYLSIFSTIYNNMEEDINRLKELLEPEMAPCFMLPVLAEWMGFDVSGEFLREDTLRRLVANSYDLIKKRGTREGFEQLIEIITGEKGIIVERNLLPEPCSDVRRLVEDNLYGDDIYGVTVLIKRGNTLYKKSQIQHLLNQLKPVRCVLKIVYLDTCSTLDGYTYMDINAGIYEEKKTAGLDWGAGIGQIYM